MPHNDAYIEDEPEGIEETHVDLQNGRSDIQIAYDGKPYAGKKPYLFALNILRQTKALQTLII